MKTNILSHHKAHLQKLWKEVIALFREVNTRKIIVSGAKKKKYLETTLALAVILTVCAPYFSLVVFILAIIGLVHVECKKIS